MNLNLKSQTSSTYIQNTYSDTTKESISEMPKTSLPSESILTQEYSSSKILSDTSSTHIPNTSTDSTKESISEMEKSSLPSESTLTQEYSRNTQVIQFYQILHQLIFQILQLIV